MPSLNELLQSADWKKEKHVQVIDAPDSVKKGDAVRFSAIVGKEIAHPNTTEHHIRWIAVYFLADGAKFPIEIARAEFTAHGESAEGPNLSTVYSLPELTGAFKTEKSGAILAASYCNIHGLWQGSKRVEVKYSAAQT